jgi:hypothetical protein
VIVALSAPDNTAQRTRNSWFFKGLKVCSSLHLTGTGSARPSRARDEPDTRGTFGQIVTRFQDRPVSRCATSSRIASGVFAAVPPGDRGTNLWMTVKQKMGQTNWSIWPKERCYRQSGLAQCTRHFHEVQPLCVVSSARPAKEGRPLALLHYSIYRRSIGFVRWNRVALARTPWGGHSPAWQRTAERWLWRDNCCP